MNILPIYTYDHPILRKKLEKVELIDDELIQLTTAMHATMRNAEGIGLAANQIGRDLAIAVVDVSGVKGYENIQPITMINPVVEAFSDEEAASEEGCLSLPDLRADVIRPKSAQVRYYDLDMKEHLVEADELLARVMQHEIDHLNGIYFFDLVTPMRRTMMKRRLMDIKRGLIEAEYPLFGQDERA